MMTNRSMTNMLKSKMRLYMRHHQSDWHTYLLGLVTSSSAKTDLEMEGMNLTHELNELTDWVVVYIGGSLFGAFIPDDNLNQIATLNELFEDRNCQFHLIPYSGLSKTFKPAADDMESVAFDLMAQHADMNNLDKLMAAQGKLSRLRAFKPSEYAVNRILDKIYRNGADSLTEYERFCLQRFSSKP